MPKRFLIACFILFSVGCYAQRPDDQPSPVEDVSRLSFLSPGLSFEKSIGKKQSLYFHGFMSPSFSLFYSDAIGPQASFYMDPSLNVHYRYYYNGVKRLGTGKPTHLNNMNYVAAVYELLLSKRVFGSSYYEEANLRPVHLAGVAWGMQRNFPKRFSLDLSIGLGYLFTEGTKIDFQGDAYKDHVSTITTLGEFTLGIWLNSRK
jgi:hypothetical protein